MAKNINYYNYDVTKHKIVLTGAGAPISVSDFAEDVKFNIKYDNDFREEQMGTDGDCTVSEFTNRNATLTLNILQASPLNTLLNAMAVTGEKMAVAYTNLNADGAGGGTTPQAFFKKVADLDVASKSGKRTWEIKLINFIPV